MVSLHANVELSLCLLDLGFLTFIQNLVVSAKILNFFLGLHPNFRVQSRNGRYLHFTMLFCISAFKSSGSWIVFWTRYYQNIAFFDSAVMSYSKRSTSNIQISYPWISQSSNAPHPTCYSTCLNSELFFFWLRVGIQNSLLHRLN